MRVEWHGQAAFTVSGAEGSVLIDPFEREEIRSHGRRWDYPTIKASPDLVLVTHEHFDHNGVGAADGRPAVIRSRAGRHESPLGEVLGVASEHDVAAGTERGDNTIFVFSLDGLRVAHFGDFGQSRLRPEQREAIGSVDLLFLPVGGGPTIDGAFAAEIARQLAPGWVVPMHYRTSRIDFLEDETGFLAAFPRPLRLDAPSFDTSELPRRDAPLAVLPSAP